MPLFLFVLLLLLFNDLLLLSTNGAPVYLDDSVRRSWFRLSCKKQSEGQQHIVYCMFIPDAAALLLSCFENVLVYSLAETFMIQKPIRVPEHHCICCWFLCFCILFCKCLRICLSLSAGGATGYLGDSGRRSWFSANYKKQSEGSERIVQAIDFCAFA